MDNYSGSEQNIADEIVQEWARLSGDRGTLESHWREIAERTIPAHRTAFEGKGNFNSLANQGKKQTEFIFDSTASVALNRFAAILDSLLTPRNQTWHRLVPSDPRLIRDRQVKLWFEDLNKQLFKYRYAPRANFASQNQANWKSLGAYGTGCVFVDPLDEDESGLRYRNTHLSEIYFAENHQGIVDKAYRYFFMTARQATQKWNGKVPKAISDCVNQEQPFWFIHCVKPRMDRDRNRVDYKGMKWASYYVSISEKKLLQEGGYQVFPYAISRYEQAPGEIYGRSPAMDVLPSIKTLNEEKKTMLKQGHRTVDPVLLGPDDGILDTMSLKPGAYNAGGVTADGRPLVHALPVGNVNVGKEMMDDERAIINDAFLITLFQILTESPQMTATEVLERTKEKGILLAPTIGRQQTEYLQPLIEREIDILTQLHVIAPMPQLLLEAQGDYQIEYESPLSRAQRAEEASGLMRTLEPALQVVNISQDPSIIDHFDWDVIIPEIASIQGVPLRWMKSMDAVAQVRNKRAQQQQVQTAIQAAPGVAAVQKSNAIAQKQGK